MLKNNLWVLFAVLQALPTHAQTTDQNLLTDTTQTVAWKLLRYDGITPENIREKAISNIKKQINAKSGEPFYDFQRVEVPGITTTNDNADLKLPNIFDQQLPRFYKPPPTPTKWTTVIYNLLLGGQEAFVDQSPVKKKYLAELADCAKEVLKDLKDKEVNQLVCPGWGSEIVFQGLCDGLIKPPRRIIVLAPPDNNIEKWRALSRKIGAAVDVYMSTDKPAKKAKGNGLGKEELPSTAPELNTFLEGKLGKTNDLHNRVKSGKAMFTQHAGIKIAGQSRADYYKVLAELNRGPFTLTAQQLQAPQEALIRNEMDRIFKSAESQAQALTGHVQAALAKQLVSEKTRRDIASSPATVSASHVYLLSEVTDGPAIYFVDPQSNNGHVVFSQTTRQNKTTHGSNILITAVAPYYSTAKDKDGKNIIAPDPPLSEVQYKVDMWTDAKGHIHSIETLKRQLTFQHWLLNRPECANGCTLTQARSTPFQIIPIIPTGILDQPTLFATLMRDEWLYDTSYKALLDTCSKETGAQCTSSPWPNEKFDYWASKLTEARVALDAYAQILSSIQFTKKSPPPWPEHWEDSTPDNLYGGLEISPQPWLVDPSRRSTNANLILIRPVNNEPETTIILSADPSSLNAENLARIKVYEETAEEALLISWRLMYPLK